VSLFRDLVMHRTLAIATALLLGGFGILAEAQTEQQPAPEGAAPSTERRETPAAAVGGGLLVPGVDEQEEASYWTTSRPMVPAIVGGYGTSLATRTEMERSNYIRGGVTLQATYDDNALLSDPALSNYTYSIFPQIALDQSRSRVHWILNYAGGFTYNQRLATQNQTSQDVGFDLQYRLSPHVNVRVSEAFELTTGLFSPVNSFNGTTPGVPTGPNSFVITPLSKTLSNVTRGDLSYQFSAADVVGVSGGLKILNYRDVTPGSTLVNTTNEDAALYYMHRITASNWIGGSYAFQHLGYDSPTNDSIVHSAIAFDTWQVKPTMTLSFFVGPQYSDNKLPLDPTSTDVVDRQMWTVTGGAAFGYQAKHTSIALGYSRRITDGGGVQGSVELNSANGSLRQLLSANWTLGFTAGYGGNNALVATNVTAPNLSYISAGAAVTRQIGQRCFLQAGYLHQHQTSSGLTSVSGDADRNQVLASFSYQFARPWGR